MSYAKDNIKSIRIISRQNIQKRKKLKSSDQIKEKNRQINNILAAQQENKVKF